MIPIPEYGKAGVKIHLEKGDETLQYGKYLKLKS